MTLDEDPYAEPDWLRVARLQEQEDRDRYRQELEERDACESVEARESHWAGVMRQMPAHVRDIRYERDAG